MKIITWDQTVGDDRCSDEPLTARLTPQHMLRRPLEAVVAVPRDSEAVIMPSPFGRVAKRSDEDSAQWLADFARELQVNRRGVKWVWMDHPPNEWRIEVDGERGDRRHPAALSMFARGLMEFLPVAACQYGVNGTGGWSAIPCSPVLWTERGTYAMPDSAAAGRLMPWVRGIGQWAPNSPAPTMRSFLHDLLTCWRCGAECVLVWSDPNRTTETQLEQMGQAIDVASGLRVDVRDEPADDMTQLISTLAAGGSFADILDTLARWGGTGGDDAPDLEVRGE